ncbi:MAG TPA: S8 family serine peptidase [Mycobacteriales bacterium]|nr:S8 family serine peptidase [Mycobacteriales bacterium]
MTQRRGTKALVAAITLAVGAATTGVSAAAVHAPSVHAKGTRWDSVIVTAKNGHMRDAALAVKRVQGIVGTAIPLIEGFSAKVPAGSEAALAHTASVRSVSPDGHITFDAQTFDPSATATNPVRSTKASSLWSAGGYGQGVGVAVVDTGISPSADVTGRVVYGPDLSGEGSLIDTFGHGTVMGGIIGGDGSQSASGGHPYTGLAPKSTLISVKTAGANGATDVTTVLQALNWVSAYASQYNIRVLNLSWGLNSTQSYLLDPVDYAVERLWNQGIVVVVSAGNQGPTNGTITTPGSDPMVLTVGAYDDKANSTLSDDVVSQWSSEGPTADLVSKPDIITPGRTIIATRSHASTIEQENPQALIGDGYIKGSGTSQAAAVTSGVVADLLSVRPNLTPDQVKNILKSSANPISGVSANAQGAGRLTIPAGFQYVPAGMPYTQPSLATGLGSLEADRGGVDFATTLNGVATTITGEIDTKGEAWNPVAWTGNQWTGNQWTDGNWEDAFWGDAPPAYAPLPGEPVLDAATSLSEMLAHVQVDINLGLMP